MAGPLDGIRVLESCQMVSGPLAAMLLADLGADVVKVEAPGGDLMRRIGTKRGGQATYFAGVNRGKRSVTLDLQRPEGLSAFRSLAARSDVVLQNFRPGVAERLGIGWSDLSAGRDDLVYVSISGYGSTGPSVDDKVYDFVVQARTGIAALQGMDVGQPKLVRTILVDKATSYAVVQAVLAALLSRERGGHGQHVHVAMLEVALAFFWPDGMANHTLLDDDGAAPAQPAAHPATGYEVLPTADGWVAVLPTSDRSFPALCRALGTERWMEDPRFATWAGRDASADELRAVMSEEFRRHPSAELVERLNAVDVACGRVNPLDEVHLDEQVVHAGSLVEHERPHLGRVREPRPAWRFEGTPTDPGLGRHAPLRGEHTAEVLAELGLGEAAIRTASGG